MEIVSQDNEHRRRRTQSRACVYSWGWLHLFNWLSSLRGRWIGGPLSDGGSMAEMLDTTRNETILMIWVWWLKRRNSYEMNGNERKWMVMSGDEWRGWSNGKEREEYQGIRATARILMFVYTSPNKNALPLLLSVHMCWRAAYDDAYAAHGSTQRRATQHMASLSPCCVEVDGDQPLAYCPLNCYTRWRANMYLDLTVSLHPSTLHSGTTTTRLSPTQHPCITIPSFKLIVSQQEMYQVSISNSWCHWRYLYGHGRLLKLKSSPPTYVLSLPVINRQPVRAEPRADMQAVLSLSVSTLLPQPLLQVHPPLHPSPVSPLFFLASSSLLLHHPFFCWNNDLLFLTLSHRCKADDTFKHYAPTRPTFTRQQTFNWLPPSSTHVFIFNGDKPFNFPPLPSTFTHLDVGNDTFNYSSFPSSSTYLWGTATKR